MDALETWEVADMHVYMMRIHNDFNGTMDACQHLSSFDRGTKPLDPTVSDIDHID
jgi:hypothetical protein